MENSKKRQKENDKMKCLLFTCKCLISKNHKLLKNYTQVIKNISIHLIIILFFTKVYKDAIFVMFLIVNLSSITVISYEVSYFRTL